MSKCEADVRLNNIARWLADYLDADDDSIRRSYAMWRVGAQCRMADQKFAGGPYEGLPDRLLARHGLRQGQLGETWLMPLEAA